MSIFIEKMDNFTKQKKYPPTPTQWQAIGMNGCDILVSAAAGSGKTEVLSERISRKVALDKWDIDRLLVLTFTTAAAKNMLDRIENKIEERLLSSNNKEDLLHLKRQRLLMGDAKVTTIDSFCLNVLKKFYYLVEENIAGEKRYLAPNFKVLANNRIMLRESVDFTIENFALTDKNLLDVLFEIFDTKERVMTFLISTYTKMLSIPNYQEYIQKELVKNIITNSTYQVIYKKLVKITTTNLSEKLDSIKQIIKDLLLIKPETNNIFESNIIVGRAEFLQAELENFKLDESFNNSELLAEFLNSILIDIENTDMLTIYSKILNLIPFLESKSKIELLTVAIPKILLKIDADFLRAKRTAGFLDFSDLNHLAIKALEKDFNGKKYPTEASQYYKNLFLEIYVDEYQDNNDLQEYILNLIRGEGRYFFRVGDVKQSIYGFRGSNPDLFEEKYQTFTKISDLISDEDFDINKEYRFTNNVRGVCVILKENFRSYNNVLQSSNFIFNRLMYRKNAGITYDRDSALYFPKVKQKESSAIPTYILCAKEKEKLKLEDIIHNIAQEINSGVAKGNSYSDYAILLRSTSNIKKYQTILSEYGIPIYFKEKEGLTTSHSFNIILNLIRFLDNPSTDYSLVVLLHSAIFNFTNEDLLKLSLISGEDLYEKLKKSKDKKAEFAVKMLHRWLNFSFNYKVIDTVLLFAEDTSFMEYMRTKDIDDTEIDYYENCLDIIRESSNNDINLSYTLKVLNDIRKSGEYDTKRKSPKNSVTISTIHISKGLEYEHVFVAELDKSISKKDYDSKIIFSRELGLSIDERIWYSNSNNKNYLLNAALIKKKSYEEEIRNLYVALTRAVKTLYLATSAKINLSSEDTTNINDKEQTIGRFADVKSFADMLNIVCSYYNKEHLEDTTEQEAIFELFNMVKIAEAEKKEKAKEIQEEKEVEETELDFTFLQEKSLVKSSKVLASSKQIVKEFYPAKTSYSALKKISEKEEKKGSGEKKEYLVLDTLSEKNKTSQAIIRGNIIHKLFERIITDTEKGKSIPDIALYIDNLVQTTDVFTNIKEKRFLTEEYYNIINNEKDLQLIYIFLKSKVIELAKKATKIATEISFTTPKTAKELFSKSNNSKQVILQGVIDLLLFMDEKNYIIIDYKTDYVTKKDGIQILKERHAEQLEIYSEAVRKYYGENIKVKKYIYSYILGQLIEI